MDAAVEDGIDVLSLSLGRLSINFYADNIALGAFSAMERGILVSCSARNSGPSNFSLSNEAPWILTVGASTIDRKDGQCHFLETMKSSMASQLFSQNFSLQTPTSGLSYDVNASDSSLRICSASSLNKNRHQRKNSVM